MSEHQLFVASASGLVLVVASWLWLAGMAWGRRVGWGVGVLLFPPAGLLFAASHRARARVPVIVGLLGLLLLAGPPLVTRLVPVDLGPRDRLVDGEQHLTLTGWDRQDYGLLAERPDVVVLQMANADVTDDALLALPRFDRLRELDLNDTAISDAALAWVAALPALERLRLANTAITDAGFRSALVPHERLRELDLQGTAVTAETVSAWRAAAPGRRALH
jgi:Leucine-rich repeat (LRR) protein